MKGAVNLSYFGDIEKNFQQHLELDINERILLSGRYGKGKTTFLHYFFEKNKEKYFTICLAPVHYSIASNQDIIRYLKYDILIELLKNGYEFPRFDLTEKDLFPYYLIENPLKILASVLSFIPKVGKTIAEVDDKIRKFKEELEKYKKDYEEKAEGNVVENFIELMEADGMSIYENDFLTQTISRAIEFQKRKGLKTILIIDDMDRLDPEHVFRILNVFSSQFDNYSEQKANKFGFKKTIIVCDINNIRNIFENRYGHNVDYKGYIDKFFSVEPFYFNNNKAIGDSVHYLLKKCIVQNYRIQDTLLNYINQRPYSIGLLSIIKELIFFDFLQLRALQNYLQAPIFVEYDSFVLGNQSVYNDYVALDVEFKVLTNLLGGYNKTVGILNKLLEANLSSFPVHNYSRLLQIYSSPTKWHANAANNNTIETFTVLVGEVTIKHGITDGVLKFEQYDNNGRWVPFSPNVKNYLRLVLVLLDEFYFSHLIEE